MALPEPHLLRLPNELLFDISDLLSPDGILALKLTSRRLNTVLPALTELKNRRPNKCVRFAIERLCASPNEKPDHLRCILCKAIYPLAMFASSSSPACFPLGFAQGAPRPEIVEIPPGYCAWHVSRLVRVIRTEPGGRNEWVSDVKRMCMHSGCIEGWHDCDCACDSCGHKMVRTYTRFLNNKTECKKFHFWRNTAAGPSEDLHEDVSGRLYVQEVCWVPGVTPKQSVIQLPVHYQDVARSGTEKLHHSANSRHPRCGTSSSLAVNYDKYTAAGEFLCSMSS